MTSRKLTDRILKLLTELQAIDPVRIDVRRFSTFADAVIIAGANSTPHLRALGEEIRTALKKEGIACHIADADPDSGWMVLDYLDVVVHLLQSDLRAYYALEELWRETEPAPVKKQRPADRPDTPGSPRPAPEESTAPARPGRRRRPPA